MQTYRSGSTVMFLAQFKDAAGAVITPVSASYRLLDASESELIAETALAIAAEQTDVAVTVASAHNMLADGEVRALRQVELTYADAAGQTYTITERWMLEQVQTLAVFVNSFQTYGEALVTAHSIPDLNGWDSAEESQRKAALEEAFQRMLRLNYRVKHEVEVQRYLYATVFSGSLDNITADEFKALPRGFRDDLNRAQVAEADIILGGDQVGENRRDGLMSSSVGEVSQFFRPGKPLMLPVSNKALRYVGRYVSFSVKLTRG